MKESKNGPAEAGRKGYAVAASTLKACGAEHFFYVVGGPITSVTRASIDLGIRGIDMRDERAAAFAAIAYARLRQRPGIVMSCSGPGTTNTVTGIMHAYADGAPVVALGGSTPLYQRGTDAFQETDQVGLMRPITKWAYQVPSVDRMSDAVRTAYGTALNGAPGPVYVDLPGDILQADADGTIAQPSRAEPNGPIRSTGDPSLIRSAVDLLSRANRPIVIAGSGVLWSRAWEELRAFAEQTGVPVFTTPIARGVVAEGTPLCPSAARTTAFREADLLLVVGTRSNYVMNGWQAPVFRADKRIIEVNSHFGDFFKEPIPDVAILGDAKMVLAQLTAATKSTGRAEAVGRWTAYLHELHLAGIAKIEATPDFDAAPIHPLRLARDLDRVAPRDAVIVMDGHEIQGFARRALTAREPGHLITAGVYGTMGGGVAFGVGAKVAKPNAPVVVLSGDGAFGYHAMEIDTMVRHKLGVVIIISNNAGWSGLRHGPGYELGHTDYHKLADAFGGWGARVSDPGEITGTLTEALRFAKERSLPVVINVITSAARFEGRRFTQSSKAAPAVAGQELYNL